MDRAEYDNLKAAIEGDYASDLAAAKRKRSERIRSLGIIWEIASRKSRAETDNSAAPGSNGDSAFRRGDLTRLIQRATRQLTATFTMHDVAGIITQAFPELKPALRLASISSVLQRMVEDSSLEIEENGGGKKPTVYKHANGRRFLPEDLREWASDYHHRGMNGNSTSEGKVRIDEATPKAASSN